MQTVTVGVERYEDLVKSEAQIEILERLIENEDSSYIEKDVIRKVLGFVEQNAGENSV